MEQLFLSPFLFLQKVNIIKQQHIRIAVFIFKFMHFIFIYMSDILICKGFRRGIQNLQVGCLIQGIADCLHQVCLAQSYTTVN